MFLILCAPEWLLFAVQVPAEVRCSGLSTSVQILGILDVGIAPIPEVSKNSLICFVNQGGLMEPSKSTESQS